MAVTYKHMTTFKRYRWTHVISLGLCCACSHQPAPALDASTHPFLQSTPSTAQRTAATTPHSMADVAERALPSVVNISSSKRVQPQEQGGSPFFSDPFFRHFFGVPDAPREQRERSLGSGVIVSRDGIVLTNNHVVEQADEIRVALSDGRQLQASIVGTDPKSDVAVLRLQGSGASFTPLPFGDSDSLRLGDVVLAIGNPFGIGQTVTMGIVSAKGRANMGIVDYEDFIQTDAAINPGNSGGALVNLRGELVGINTAIVSRSGGYQGIGFAIPSNMAQPIQSSILRTGKVVRGWLGVGIQELTPELAQALGATGTKGVLLSDVAPQGPGARAGLQREDIVTAINGHAVTTPAHLRNTVASSGAGSDVTLSVLRKGRALNLRAHLVELPAALGGSAALGKEQGVLGGLTVGPLDSDARRRHHLPDDLPTGVVVENVAAGSRAAEAGIHPGDVLLEMNRVPIRSPGVFEELYRRASGQMLLVIYREGNSYYLILRK